MVSHMETDIDYLSFQVSALFKDGTIGGNINIAIVGLILLEEEQVFYLYNSNFSPRKINAK